MSEDYTSFHEKNTKVENLWWLSLYKVCTVLQRVAGAEIMADFIIH
jgi:hypothetical protein